MERITAAEMARYLAIDRRGQFFADIGNGEWVGLSNTDGCPAMCRGSLADVLESFVPFTGEVRVVTGRPAADGIERTADTVRRFPLADYYMHKRRHGVKQKVIRKEIA